MFAISAEDGVFCFNTQPPEGGWGLQLSARRAKRSFNTQPPEGGWRRVV